jgi:cystathionine beta-lyase
MSLRLKQSEANGLALAHMVEGQKHVKAVLHPALESSPDHAIYKRDFTGSCGLFGFVLSEDLSQEVIDEAVNNLALFQIGASWGGFESLITQAVLSDKNRSFAPDISKGYLMRIYAGLEDEGDLLANLQTFFDKLG